MCAGMVYVSPWLASEKAGRLPAEGVKLVTCRPLGLVSVDYRALGLKCEGVLRPVGLPRNCNSKSSP